MESKTNGMAVGAWALAAVAACSGDHSAAEQIRQQQEAGSILASSNRAAQQLVELRQRFVQVVRRPLRAQGRERNRRDESQRVPVIGAGAVDSFGPVEGGRVRVVVNEEARRRVSKPATVALPVRASEAVHIEDETSHLAIDFVLDGASDVEIATASGIALYEGALRGADVVHRVHAEGTEDYVVFERMPEREELRYEVDVSAVAGMRLVSNVLEFLDREGTPRLRVAAPYVVDAAGERHEATTAVEGCAYDTDPRGPSWRAVTPPGARSCGVRVAWARARYPAIVDPGWMATGSLTKGREYHTASLLLSGKVLVTGGFNPAYTTLGAELYDPATGTWSSTASMKNIRWHHTASVLPDGTILVAGGENAAMDAQASTELYDPATGTWSSKGFMTEGRRDHTASVLPDGKVLAAGGHGSVSVSNHAELYDPATGTWSSTGSMASGRQQHTASVLPSGNVLVAGGDGGGLLHMSAELYDPATSTWGSTGSMAARRRQHTASVLPSGNVLVAGGYGINSTHLASTELYDLGAGNWSSAGSLTKARSNHTASVLQGGQVLVAGGDGIGSVLTSTELYDPAMGLWSSTASLATERQYHAASVLQSGQVLVAGGEGTAFGIHASVEVLDPPEKQGAACVAAQDCLSGFCVDSVCCDSACNGGAKGCRACSEAAGAQSDGTCAMLTGTLCDDKDKCTQTDTCNAGTCIGDNPIVCMPENECHIGGICHAATGICSNPDKPDGATCSNGTCQNGACQGGTSSGTGAAGGSGGGSSGGGSSGGGGGESMASGGGGQGGPEAGGCTCTTASGSASGWLWSLSFLTTVPLVARMRRHKRDRAARQAKRA
jgi:uncharacterized membrane protein YgcG